MAIQDFIPVRIRNGNLEVLDQTLLPGEEVFITIESTEVLYDAIKKLKVRGAPAIGVAAGYGIWIACREAAGEGAPDRVSGSGDAGGYASAEDYLAAVRVKCDYLVSARPTAVNLKWAAERVMKRLEDESEALAGRKAEDIGLDGFIEKLTDAAFEEADAIRQEDYDACYAMAENGLNLLSPGMGVLTHCNAGVLATAGYGTALSPLHLGQERGYGFKVFADETRPLLQGARLTAWELMKSGIDVTVICDNMASTVMKQGLIDAVVVGCDRMAANGDGANKIGTSGVAVLAKEYGIPFYMFVPTSTIDIDTPTGDDIVIEERDPEEIRSMWYEKPMAPQGVKAYNPAFDVTPAEYITAVVTEKGVIFPPFAEGIKKIVQG
jgi:methylthioribose-1-phosphate isomerase